MLDDQLPGLLAGGVHDNLGQALPGAVVTLTPQPQVTVTDSSGAFVFPEVAPGTYTVKAELEGFYPVVDAKVVVSAGRDTAIRLTMTIAGGE